MNKIISREQMDKQDVFGMGSLNSEYAAYFTGTSYLKSLTVSEKGEYPVFNVTFEPACRNNWHVHHASKGGGQVLICTAGEGWYQEWDKEPISLIPGMVVSIPANVKHWHGAKKDSWFSHITFEPAGENTSNEWLEPVDDRQYFML